MIGKRLTAFAKENSMTATEDYAYGYYNSYMTTIRRSGTHISVSFAVRIYDSNHSRKYSDFLCDHKVKVLYSVSDIVFSETYLEIIFVDSGNTVERIRTCMDIVTDMFKLDHITNNKVCTVCGEPIEPETSGVYLYDGRAHIMNHACVERINADLDNQRKRNKGLRNYFLIKTGRKKRINVPDKIVKLK